MELRGVPEFERWYCDEHPRLLGSISALCADRDVAADVTDEAFTRALADWSRVAVMTSPAGWTYRVALHALRRRHRRRNHEVRLIERIEPLTNTAIAPDAFAAHADVWVAVAALPDRQRTAVVLRYVADLPEAAIAEAMGVTRGTVASNLSDARRSLATLLIDDEPTIAESAP